VSGHLKATARREARLQRSGTTSTHGFFLVAPRRTDAPSGAVPRVPFHPPLLGGWLVVPEMVPIPNAQRLSGNVTLVY
jgi:hypothetical protein